MGGYFKSSSPSFLQLSLFWTSLTHNPNFPFTMQDIQTWIFFFKHMLLLLGHYVLKYLKIGSKFASSLPLFPLYSLLVVLSTPIAPNALLKSTVSHVYISSTDLSSGFNIHISNHLFCFPKRIDQKHLKLKAFKTIQNPALLLDLFLH